MTKNELKVNGTQKFMGIDIPIVEGGFSEKCRVVSAKTIAEIHETRLKEINQSINRLIKKGRFTENIDYIDLFSNEIFKVTASDLGLITSNGQKQCFIVSERGYTKLAKYMDDDKSWDVMEQFVDEYFTMREVIKSNEQQKAQLLLSIYDGGKNAVLASKQLTELEVKEATAPLIAENAELKPKAEFHDAVSIAENCVNFGDFAATFQNNNKVSFGRNKIMDWCRNRSYLCSSHHLKNKPSQQMIDSNYMKYKENVNERNGKQYITYTPLLTGKGQIWLTKKLLKYFEE